ncbi:MAG: HD-GYP domain-containing protein, partial [Clostridia bacterium]|nr:HD-GYP domain-containing protein [Clostridia bacterium]
FAGMLVMYLLMMLIVNRIITKPLSTLQSAVKDFTENNDCNSVAEKVDRIRSKNEIGTLSRDFKNLAFEVDEYIKEIQKAEREIANVSNELLVSLALTIDAKDKYTNGHSLRVASYSKMLAQRLGFSEKDCDRIYKMGLLHDIGKIGIPNNIINKKGKLTDEEYDVIKTHTVRGYEILKEINSFPELAEAAKWHHEKFDGTGYPDKLTGAETSLEIRIISVADSYDAMTSNRSYRGYMAQDTVKKEIEKNSGTQFDPIIAKEMIGIIEADKDYQLHEFAPENIGE